MKLERGSGLLLHVTSLPSPFGIGDLGPQAFHFVDLAAEAGQRYWQILPLNPTDPIYGNSPYLSVSAFALNPLLISPELLYRDGLLQKSDLASSPSFREGFVDYGLTMETKERLLDKAFERWQGKESSEFLSFCSEQAFWLNDYALFTALRRRFAGKSWTDWPKALRDRRKDALAEAEKAEAEVILGIKFRQFILHRQWHQLKEHCAQRGVRIIGDLPIYVEHGSADVWCAPHLFKLDKNGHPIAVAGVPPDYFSETGQRWGNPVYDWEAMRRDGFRWWADRLRRNLGLFDLVRIDHFRGLVAYWEIPAEEKTAINGKWIQVPTEELFNVLRQSSPSFNVIAEDLGVITDDVRRTMERYQLPGMKILQFAFGGDLQTNPYLPHNYPENCLVYTGTHDNNTTRGWYRCDATDAERWNLGVYFGREINEGNVCRTLIEAALTSRAAAAVIPVQDVLELDESARMNVPGKQSGNWQWRLREGVLTRESLHFLRDLTQKSGRV